MSIVQKMINTVKLGLFTSLPSRFPQYAVHTRRIGVFNKGKIKLKLDMRSNGHRYIMSKTFEQDLSQVLLKVPNPGDVIVDIGAHIGWHSLNILVNRPDVSQMVSFEPYPTSRHYLEFNIDLNGMKERCRISPKAVGEAVGATTLKIFKNMNEMHNSLYSLGDSSFDEIDVEITTLDTEFSDRQLWPAVIKCDVEGNELAVLHGSSELLTGSRGTPPIWFLEANYETAAMAGYFPWELIDVARSHSPYEGFYIRDGSIKALPSSKSLRHGDTLILAIPKLHTQRLEQVNR